MDKIQIMFHIDTHAPGSFTVGIIRLIKMASGILNGSVQQIFTTVFRIVKNKNDILHPAQLNFIQVYMSTRFKIMIYP